MVTEWALDVAAAKDVGAGTKIYYAFDLNLKLGNSTEYQNMEAVSGRRK